MEKSQRDAYYQKMTAQLEEVEAKLGTFKANVKEKVADARIAADGNSGDLERHRSALRQKLDELRNSADDRWENVKNEVEQRWTALKDYAARKQA
jgi:dsDNA-specific endonuclease/ATPase MutS2